MTACDRILSRAELEPLLFQPFRSSPASRTGTYYVGQTHHGFFCGNNAVNRWDVLGNNFKPDRNYGPGREGIGWFEESQQLAFQQTQITPDSSGSAPANAGSWTNVEFSGLADPSWDVPGTNDFLDRKNNITYLWKGEPGRDQRVREGVEVRVGGVVGGIVAERLNAVIFRANAGRAMRTKCE